MPDLDVDSVVLSDFPDPVSVPDTRTALERAHDGELLNARELMEVFRLKKSRFHQLLKAGAFDQFKTQPAIGSHCYSGVKVARYLSGDPIYEPTFGRKRR